MLRTLRDAARWSRRILPAVLFSASAALLMAGQPAQEPAEEALAREILGATGVEGGLIVHLGCGDGRLTAALRAGDRYLVHGLDRDAAKVAAAREMIQRLGLYGPVSVDQLTGERLPYADNLAGLVVSEDLGGVTLDELMRVLAPGGVAYVNSGGQWTKNVKPWPAEMDQWTHFFHDASGNAVAEDTLVDPPTSIRWVAKPLYCRSHEIDSSISALVSAGGRIFYILDEGLTGITDQRLPARWSLVARDAFSGVLLWKRPIPRWGWREWKREELEGKDWTQLRGQRVQFPAELPRRLVADGDRVYVTLGYAAGLSILDAATGEIVRECEGTEGTHEIVYQSGVLVVRIANRLADELERRTGKTPPEEIAAIEADTGKTLWRKATAPLRPLTLAIGGDRVVFHTAKELVCSSLASGEERWRQNSNPGHTLVVHDGVVLIIDPQALRAFSVESGETLWTGPGGQGPGAGTDLFVVGGLVWHGRPAAGPGFAELEARYQQHAETGVRMVGYDLKTGEVRKTVEIDNLLSAGHHFRCYRSKATARRREVPPNCQ